MISYNDRRAGLPHHNRDIVSEDMRISSIPPRKGTKDRSQCSNEADEVCHLLVDFFTLLTDRRSLRQIRRFFEHIRTAKPKVMAHVHGDSLTSPFPGAAKAHGIDMFLEMGSERILRTSSSAARVPIWTVSMGQAATRISLRHQGLKQSPPLSIVYDH